jgi:hypothetical protein
MNIQYNYNIYIYMCEYMCICNICNSEIQWVYAALSQCYPTQLKNGTDESNLSSVQTINIFQHLEFHSSNFDWLRSTQIDSDWLRLSKHPFRSSPPVQSFIASVMAASWSFGFDGVAMVSSVALMRKASSGLEACWDGPNGFLHMGWLKILLIGASHMCEMLLGT